MASVLDELRTTWGTKPGLTALIPTSRVFVGRTNPGTPTPSICLHTQTVDSGQRTSSRTYPSITVEALAEAETPDFLEQLADQMSSDLEVWQSTRYAAVRLAGMTSRVYRDDDTPKQNWIGEIQLTYQTYR